MPAVPITADPRSADRGQLAMLVTSWLAAQRSPNTRAAYRYDIETFIAWCESNERAVLSAGTQDVESFSSASVLAGASTATIGRRLASVSSFFRFVAASGGSRANPVDDVARPQRPTSAMVAGLDASEAAAVWGAALALGPKTATLVGLMLHDGLRVGQVLALDVCDVRTGRSRTVLQVRRRGSAEAIEVDHRTAAVLAAYRRGRAAGPLLLGDSPTRAAQRLTRFGADYLIKRSGQSAGVARPLTATTLRRTHLARDGQTLAP